MKKLFIVVSCYFIIGNYGYGQSPSFQTYMNPVIPGDHPDCTLTKVGDDFYTTGSSFNVTPVIFHSTDLVHWEAIAQPVRASWPGYGDSPGGGCWGGHMVYYNGQYWDFFSQGGYMRFVTAADPSGPWSDPVTVNNPPQLPYTLGYDNSIFIDDNGKWYLVVKNGQPNNGIVELGNDGQPTGVVYNLTWLNPSPYPYSWAEGPVMWKYKGYYYYSFAENLGGGQWVMRSDTLTANQASWQMLGYFFNENDPKKSGSLFTSPNHASPVVMTDDSTHWVVHPLYAKGEWTGQGRQGLLNQVRYDSNLRPVADYPINESFTAPQLPSSGIPWMVPKSDFFDSGNLNPEWSFLGYTPDALHSLTDRPGWLRLSPKSITKANTVIKNDGEHNYSLVTRLEFHPQSTNDGAGLRIMRGDEASFVKLYSSVNASSDKVIVFSCGGTRYESDNIVGDILWLKIIRENHIVSGCLSSNGIDWIQVGESFNISSIDSYSDLSTFTGTRQGLYVEGVSDAFFDLYIYRDAYTPIMAGWPANQFGAYRTSSVLDSVHNNDWALYAGVEFGGNSDYPKIPDSLEVVASSATSGGVVEVWLDSIGTGNKIAECNISSTSNWTTFETFTTDVSLPVSGNHDVYLKFSGGGSDRLFILQSLNFIGTSAGCYKSYQSGDWNNNSVWAMYNGADWETPVTLVPDSASGPITIQSGHQVQVTDNKIVDQLFIQPAGTLQIATEDTVIINDGLGIDLTLDGVLLNYGTINKDDSAVVWVRDDGKYTHARDGDEIPIAAWTSGATCEITGVVSNLPLNAGQDFYHFIWNCSGQASDINTGWNGCTIGGNINIQNTGTGVLQLCSPAADTPVVINIDGDFNQTSGIFATHMSNEGGTSVTINQGGNINITGGQFRISGGTQGGTGTTAWNLTNGNFSISDADIENGTTTPLGAGFVFKKAGTQNLNIGSGNTIVALPIEVSSGTTLNIGTSELTGNGHFVLDSAATLEIAHSNGIDGNIQIGGSRILSKSANYTYNGSVVQVTGSSLPDTVNNLTLNNSAGLTLSSDVVINGTMEIKEGLIQSGAEVLSYGEDGALKYSGSSAQTTGNVEFPAVGGPKDLLISNTAGVNLHASRQIRGTLNLSAKLVLEANTLTAGSATTASVTTMFVNTDGGGKLKLPVANSTEVLYPVGASGGSTVSFCPVWITNNGDGDTITLGAVMDTMNATKPRVNLKWSIEGSTDSGNYAMKFGWNTTTGVHENSLFRTNRTANARIFLMGNDTIEAGSGDYEFSFDLATRLFTAKRGGIIELGTFAVGKFKDSVWMGVEEELPRSYRLLQNYPNPFNSVTVIRYELPRSEEVELVIYNLLGRQIAVLEKGKKDAGYYKVEWKASNLPTGVYFYRLTAGSFSDTKKFLFIK